MKLKVQEKEMAIKLRKMGYSYREISKELNLPKSSLSHWLSDLVLSDAEITLLRERNYINMSQGRLNAAAKNTERRIEREKTASNIAKREFELHINDSFFAVGVTMYWAEGAKKNGYFQFVNSDPAMISLMMKWIEKFLKIDKSALKYRLFIHKPYADENLEEFWSAIVQVPAANFHSTVYKPTPHLIKKNPNYKGCFRISEYGIDTFRKVFAWQKLLIEYYNKAS